MGARELYTVWMGDEGWTRLRSTSRWDRRITESQVLSNQRLKSCRAETDRASATDQSSKVVHTRETLWAERAWLAWRQHETISDAGLTLREEDLSEERSGFVMRD